MRTGVYMNEEGIIFIVSKYFNKYIVETQEGFLIRARNSLLEAFAFNHVKFLGEL